MKISDLSRKYGDAENHFDVFLTSLTASPVSLLLFVAYSVGLVILGRVA